MEQKNAKLQKKYLFNTNSETTLKISSQIVFMKYRLAKRLCRLAQLFLNFSNFIFNKFLVFCQGQLLYNFR